MEHNLLPMPANFLLNVQMLLQAERAKEWEAKKRKHEEEVAEAFKEHEGTLKDVWFKMSGYIMTDKTMELHLGLFESYHG